MRKEGWQLNSEHCTSKRRYVTYQPSYFLLVQFKGTKSTACYSHVQNSIESFIFWIKMPMFQRAGMKVGLPLPTALQYIYNSCDMKSMLFEFHHDICTALYRGWRPWQNRILILVFFSLRAQFCMYNNTLDILQVFPSGWTCLKLCFSSSKLNWFSKKSPG